MYILLQLIFYNVVFGYDFDFFIKDKIAISNKEWYNYEDKNCEKSNIKVNISSVTLHMESFKVQVNQVVSVNETS